MVDEQNITSQRIGDSQNIDISLLTEGGELEEASYKRLTAAQIALILQLSEQQKTQTEVANIIGVTQATVSRTLSKFRPTTHLAELRAKAAALPAVRALVDNMEAALRDGDTKPVELVLELAGMRKKGDDGTRTAVQVVVGMPGATQYCDPLAGGENGSI
jgi:predicted XRE-type DNA-binding protein